jgi:hypothetical protein
VRTFDEAKAELERHKYKVITPFFVANKVRVVRPDGSEERVRDRFHLAMWARKELGIADLPVSDTPSLTPQELAETVTAPNASTHTLSDKREFTERRRAELTDYGSRRLTETPAPEPAIPRIQDGTLLGCGAEFSA